MKKKRINNCEKRVSMAFSTPEYLALISSFVDKTKPATWCKKKVLSEISKEKIKLFQKKTNKQLELFELKLKKKGI